MVAILARMEIAGHEAGLPPTIFWVASYEHLRGRIPGTRRRRQVIRETKERDNRSVHSAGPNSVAPCIRWVVVLSSCFCHFRRIMSAEGKDHAKMNYAFFRALPSCLSFRRSMSAEKKNTRKTNYVFFRSL